MGKRPRWKKSLNLANMRQCKPQRAANQSPVIHLKNAMTVKEFEKKIKTANKVRHKEFLPIPKSPMNNIVGIE
ncbi:MAG: hypothetical protein WC375_10595 [Methanomassiliicoccales archaeon]|jgi:hypothetical protein